MGMSTILVLGGIKWKNVREVDQKETARLFSMMGKITEA